MVKFVNNIKTVLLLGGLMGLCLGLGALFGGKHGMLIGLVFGGVGNIIAYFFSDKIAIASMRGQEVGPDASGAAGGLYHVVDELRQRAGMPMPKVYICPQEAPNAFATGRSPSKAAVAVTEGALRLLSLDELRGVMAHELAHVKNRDTLTSCIAATIAGVISYLAQFALFFGGDRDRANPIAIIAAMILAPLGAALIQAMISRSREYVADADGAKIAGSPNGLISALQKLELYSQRIPMQNPNPAANNLFIVEPMVSMKTLGNLFATHPPVENRIASLRRVGQEMSGTLAVPS